MIRETIIRRSTIAIGDPDQRNIVKSDGGADTNSNSPSLNLGDLMIEMEQKVNLASNGAKTAGNKPGGSKV